MGQFKPMPKMETTEPSVILKLKKGGTVAKKAIGGALPAPASPMAETALANRLASSRPRGAALMRSAAPVRPQPAMPAQALGRVKKGGVMKKAEGGESRAEHAAEMKKLSKVESELKSHENKPASKGHKGLKTGGVAKKFATGGVIKKYATGGVVNKYASGGCVEGFKATKKGGSW